MGGVCGEAELVVDDEVKGPAHSEPWQVGQGQGLCNDALAGECSVSVNLEAQRLSAGREWWGAETLAQSCRTLAQLCRTLAQSCRTLAHAILGYLVWVQSSTSHVAHGNWTNCLMRAGDKLDNHVGVVSCGRGIMWAWYRVGVVSCGCGIMWAWCHVGMV